MTYIQLRDLTLEMFYGRHQGPPPYSFDVTFPIGAAMEFIKSLKDAMNSVNMIKAGELENEVEFMRVNVYPFLYYIHHGDYFSIKEHKEQRLHNYLAKMDPDRLDAGIRKVYIEKGTKLKPEDLI